MINKTKSWFVEMIKSIHLWIDLPRKTGRGLKSTKPERKRSYNGHKIYTKIVTDYDKQLCANKTDNLEEMDKFLERYNLSRLNQEEIENINRSTTSTETETVVKKLPAYKSPGADCFTGKSHQRFREEFTPILL